MKKSDTLHQNVSACFRWAAVEEFTVASQREMEDWGKTCGRPEQAVSKRCKVQFQTSCQCLLGSSAK